MMDPSYSCLSPLTVTVVRPSAPCTKLLMPENVALPFRSQSGIYRGEPQWKTTYQHGPAYLVGRPDSPTLQSGSRTFLLMGPQRYSLDADRYVRAHGEQLAEHRLKNLFVATSDPADSDHILKLTKGQAPQATFTEGHADVFVDLFVSYLPHLSPRGGEQQLSAIVYGMPSFELLYNMLRLQLSDWGARMLLVADLPDEKAGEGLSDLEDLQAILSQMSNANGHSRLLPAGVLFYSRELMKKALRGIRHEFANKDFAGQHQ